jgi:hypothetical protein
LDGKYNIRRRMEKILKQNERRKSVINRMTDKNTGNSSGY